MGFGLSGQVVSVLFNIQNFLRKEKHLTIAEIKTQRKSELQIWGQAKLLCYVLD